jgi:hypothetical protein
VVILRVSIMIRQPACQFLGKLSKGIADDNGPNNEGWLRRKAASTQEQASSAMVSVADALAAGHDQIPNYRPPLTRDRDRIDAVPPRIVGRRVLLGSRVN